MKYDVCFYLTMFLCFEMNCSISIPFIHRFLLTLAIYDGYIFNEFCFA